LYDHGKLTASRQMLVFVSLVGAKWQGANILFYTRRSLLQGLLMQPHADAAEIATAPISHWMSAWRPVYTYRKLENTVDAENTCVEDAQLRVFPRKIALCFQSWFHQLSAFSHILSSFISQRNKTRTTIGPM